MRRIYLNPGELYFGEGQVLVETLLGSCVAIVLRHRARAVGGVCHFLLPERLRHNRGGLTQDGRYGAEAFGLLLAQAHRRGCATHDFEAKLFGGARVFDSQSVSEGVGEANARFAEQLLHDADIPLLSSDLGGAGYRFLRVDLGQGDVWVRRGHPLMGAVPRPSHARGGLNA
ncbi:putative chemoreceptor glutamine deamidase CheD [Chitiniphilus shinanonensis]|uniref:Probable chemoreceptor glutamine deamidase CheD n=1 Tax=Chitiniphilus shinanonensis TaxID=553088 RepID=A0ABQ6BST1_9NEIS|nr:chemotaxis protein CheD [Chitiniphilus shinanonensis]GLS04564.1 putative chemoreceptor glutamine deamidase CheD [Chitiniphilus shinanonensis]